MTYGWSILIIAVVLGALAYLGVFNPLYFAPKANSGSCQAFRPNGAGTSYDINLLGACNGEIPQYVANFQNQQLANVYSNNPFGFPSGNVFTIVAWIYPKTYGFQGIFSFGSGCNYNTATLLLWNGYLDYDGCGNNKGSNLLAPLNSWNFVAMSLSGNSVMFYLGGSNEGPYTLPYTPDIAPQSMYIGYDMEDPFSGYYMFNGLIADVQLYNSSLGQNSITALYQEGIGGAPIDLHNLVGWWPLNGNANDYSGNGNNGVPANVVYTSSWISSYNPP